MDSYTKEDRIVRVQIPICDRTQNTELAMDISLPDYQPEIKRLLRVRAAVHPADKYIGTGNAEFSGTLDYIIYYAGNDGALYSATQTGEYRFTVPMESTAEYDLGEGILCDVNVLTDAVSGRVISPRKIALKCRLRSRVRMYASKVISAAIRGETHALEALTGNAESARVFWGSSDTVRLADEILTDAQMQDLRVIAAEGEVFVSEATAGSGIANCRGEVCLKLLTVQESGGTPNVLQRRIPFAQEITVDGAEVNCACTVSGVCTDLNIMVEEGRILCEVGAILHARAQRNETVSYLRDVYSTQMLSSVGETTCVLPKAILCVNSNFSLNQILKLADVGIAPNAVIADLYATPASVTAESENGKIYLIGKCRCHAILAGAEEMSAQEFEVPFRFEAGTLGKDEVISDYSAQANVILCRARVDGERISVDAELAVSLAVMGETRFRMVTEAKFGEKIDREASVYTVCYPSKDDTLWSVAKRYHRPVSAISEINHLDGAPAADAANSLSGVKYLLV